MHDIFIEYLVKRKKTPRTTLLKLGILAAAILVALLALTFSQYLGALSIIGSLAAVGAAYGAYYLITSLNVEFEYSVTNGEMDVDKITAQRKRRRLVTVKCREVESFGRYKPDEHAQKSYQTKIIACADPASGECWYCTSRVKDKGLTLVVFDANDRMLEAMKPFLPRPVMHDAFRMGAV